MQDGIVTGIQYKDRQKQLLPTGYFFDLRYYQGILKTCDEVNQAIGDYKDRKVL